MTFQKVTRHDPTGAREKAMANVKTVADNIPKLNWLDELLDRRSHGEILTAAQIDMLKRARKL